MNDVFNGYVISTQSDLSLKRAIVELIDLQHHDETDSPEFGWSGWYRSKLDSRTQQLQKMIANHVIAEVKGKKPKPGKEKDND